MPRAPCLMPPHRYTQRAAHTTRPSALIPRPSDDDGLVNRLVLPEAADGERGAVEGAVFAVVQELGEGEAGGGGFRGAVAGEAGGEVEALDVGVGAEDGVVVPLVRVVETAPH